MRIGLNLLYLLPGIVGGTENYAAGLLHGFAKKGKQHEFFVFVNEESSHWPMPDATNMVRVICPLNGSIRWQRYYFEQMSFKTILSRYKIDILHSLGYVGPLKTPCPSVVTIHDLNFRVNEMSVVRRVILEFFVLTTARRSNRIVAVSEFSRNEIVDQLKVPGDKVAVVHEAPIPWEFPVLNDIQSSSILDKYNIREPYLLAFSNQCPHKNINGLLGAYALSRRQYGLTHTLILVGHHPATIDMASVMGEWGNNAVVFTGYLDRKELQSILHRADLLVFPSFYEGFGLPVLEAMSLGVPVVCSASASLPEVAGNAGVYFNPYSVSDMAQKISEVAMNPVLRAELRTKGFENLERFSWEKAAIETLDIYNEVFCRAI